MQRPTVTAKEVRSLLTYQRDTGIFIWRVSPAKAVPTGSVAGSPNSKGYLMIQIRRRLYMAHRLAWLYVYGKWPSEQLDHINGDKRDNRIANLREATGAQNCANRKRRSDNKSGYKGVCWHRRSGKWHAQICASGKSIHIGYFADVEEAAEAYRARATSLLGEFARS